MNRFDPLPPHEPRPVVLLPACNRVLGQHPFHIAGRKYVEAVRLAGALPLIVPYADASELDELLDFADGVLLTGSPSNVHPSHFDEDVLDATLPLDTARDAWTLPLARLAIERGVPMFAICRGFQETNVALGGSLHQAVHAQPGFGDHRDRDEDPVDVQYGPAHAAHIQAGGLLEDLLRDVAEANTITVNSLHGQGVNRLAAGLRIEARAPDGVVEAFSRPGSPGFLLGVQWHPEWRAAENPVSMKLLRAFGEACRSYRATKRETLRERPRVP